ncbi:MAG: gamma-glutamylcyclotransferase [Rhodobacteraceae bacterium]|nr:gamma-glutamylcyclotransferase [Paracoccaceae bacterium]
MSNIFLYGTLCDKELLEVCLGRSLDNINIFTAKLENHSVYWVKNRNFPVIKFNHGSYALGRIIFDLKDSDLERLDFYEGSFNYELRKVTIKLENRDKTSFFDEEEAYVYFNCDDKIEVSKNWSLDEWQTRYGLISRLVAKEYMTLKCKLGEIDLLSEYKKIYDRLSAKL